jgi:hypothetical protein
MAVELLKVYYLRGATPKHWRIPYRIKNPPTAGYQFALVDRKDNGRCQVLCPYSLESWLIPSESGELIGAERFEIVEKVWVDKLKSAWAVWYSRDAQRNFSVVAHFLDLLGAKPPSLKNVQKAPPRRGVKPKEGRKPRSSGKLVLEDKLRPIKPVGRRADVTRYFLKEASVPGCMAKLGLTRSGVLSHLYCINRDHGLGYELTGGDAAKLIVPKGHVVFEDDKLAKKAS